MSPSAPLSCCGPRPGAGIWLLAVTAAARTEDRSTSPKVGVALRGSRLLLAEATDRHPAELVQYLRGATAARRFCPAPLSHDDRHDGLARLGTALGRRREATLRARGGPHRIAHEQDP